MNHRLYQIPVGLQNRTPVAATVSADRANDTRIGSMTRKKSVVCEAPSTIAAVGCRRADCDSSLASKSWMSNELATTKILVCPADHSRQFAESWSSFSADHCSYEIVTPELRKGDTNSVFLRCRIHGYTGYADDRLLDASGRLVKPQRLW